MASRFLAPLAPFGGRGLAAHDPFLDFRRDIDRLFEDSFRGLGEGTRGAFQFAPSIDINETRNGWEISAELPGVAEDDIDIRLDGDMLTFSGEKRDERKDEKNRIVERSYGSFRRSIQLPFTPDPDQVKADFDKGVLTLNVPRGAEQERSRQIPISGRETRKLETTRTGEQPAVGKEWGQRSETETKQGELAEEQAKKGQGAPA